MPWAKVACLSWSVTSWHWVLEHGWWLLARLDSAFSCLLQVAPVT